MAAATGSTSTLAIGIESPFRDTALRPPTSCLLSFPSKSLLSVPRYPSFVSPSRLGKKTITLPCSGRGRFPIVKASLSPDPAGSAAQIAPLQLQSPIGQFLSQILTTHAHLLPAAVDQQLEQLQTQRHAEEQTQEPSASASHDIVLYRRIAEIKANERRRALEEILYAMVVQRFMDANVSLIPVIASSPYERVETWAQDDEKLERLHSSEASEMIRNHLALVLGNRIGDFGSVAQISKLRVGQVYAASVMYGYFLKRVDERFQLEKTVKVLPADANATGGEGEGEGEEWDFRPEISSQAEAEAEDHISPGESGLGIKPSRLRTYVMSFDGDTLQRLATIRSKEAVSIIERHTEALFGRPQIAITPEGTLDTSKDEIIKISFAGLKRLVLEAVTFGSFLWDVETYVDSRYHFVMN